MTIAESVTKSSSVTVAGYLKTDMTKKVLTDVKLPKLDPNVYKFRSYKVRHAMDTIQDPKKKFSQFFISTIR